MFGLLSLSTFASPRMLHAKKPRHVLVVGAGAAGLIAGYRLQQRGIDFQILEASTTFGGRMKRNLGFADFPLPLGAEWLHTRPKVLDTLVDNPATNVAVQTLSYDQKDVYAFWDGMVLTQANLGREPDLKFVNSSWFDFFEAYIVPSVIDQIRFQNPVTTIDTSQGRATVQTQSGVDFSGDAIIVTVPLKMLQRRQITFIPPLPQPKIDAIDTAIFWEGYKAFLEFDEPFYPAYTEIEVNPRTSGQHGFYDASYGQNTRRHILGLFAVGSAARPYLGVSEAVVAHQILSQLDEIFDGRATPSFRKIITQDWSNEPHIGGAYLQDHEDWKQVRQLGNSVGSNLHFAGEAYTTGEEWGAVHNAALAAKRVVDRF
ncbi:FAD-dependent oxidoreductase [uncultured Maritalea sp.]|uniref:flavin monoamine oxidase family protein n=1 Tax=uncultured Maritalea sp. TaxID=757249 RepID=UPI002621E271|nr:FAD-dependent oxidoreductase [uncultured Maritalea sp.]